MNMAVENISVTASCMTTTSASEQKIGLDSVNQRGQPNMTVHDFRQFVNDSLLPEMTQERDDGILIFKIFKIFIYLFIYVFCVAHSKWRHPGNYLGFEVRQTGHKSRYIDGHERDDVRLYRNKYIE